MTSTIQKLCPDGNKSKAQAYFTNRHSVVAPRSYVAKKMRNTEADLEAMAKGIDQAADALRACVAQLEGKPTSADIENVTTQVADTSNLLKDYREQLCVLEQVKAQTYCLSYRQPWRWDKRGPPDGIRVVRLLQNVVMRCRDTSHPLRKKKSDWEVAGAGFTEDEDAWTYHFDFERLPDGSDVEWTLPTAEDDEALSAAPNGRTWYCVARVPVYLFYPGVPPEPEDGKYWVVFAPDCEYHPGPDTEVLQLKAGPTRNAERIKRLQEIHGGPDKVAIWRRWSLS